MAINKMEKVENKKEDEKNEKNYEFQKYLKRVSGSDNNLIKREEKKTNINNSQLYQTNSNIKKISNNLSENEKQDKNIINNNNINFNMTFNNSNSTRNINKNNIKMLDLSKSKDFNNSNSLLNKNKKYENIQDIKTIINIIKKESRENLIPIIPSNKLNIKSNNKFNQTIKSNEGSRNKRFLIESNNYTNIIQDNPNKKKEYSRIKLKTPVNKTNQKISMNAINVGIPFNENKNMNKINSADSLIFKYKWNNINKIDVNFNSFIENKNEKDEQKMTKIFNQMKDFLPRDEKALIKDRFIKYGYDKEKIFANNKKKIGIEEDINIFPNMDKTNNNFHLKSLNYEGK